VVPDSRPYARFGQLQQNSGDPADKYAGRIAEYTPSYRSRTKDTRITRGLQIVDALSTARRLGPGRNDFFYNRAHRI
jgi:hypothetical protein